MLKNHSDLTYQKKNSIDSDLASKLQNYLIQLGQTLPLFKHIREEINLEEMAPTVAHFQKFKDVIILGTGGSSLGGQTLYDLCDTPKVTLHFLDNIDPNTFSRLFAKLDLKSTGVIAISKSGGTAETLMQTLFCLQQFQDMKLPIPHHFGVITEPTLNGQANPMRQLAESHNITCLDHPTGIGGRFAVFSVVGLLPALIAGLDGKAILDGAKSMMNSLLEKGIHNPVVIDTITLHTLTKKGVTQSVIFPYVDRLRNFAFWYRQLWAESLGKFGKGTTPIASFGTVDQHSQLQLYLDGPKDKFFTVITLDNKANHSDTGNMPVVSTLDSLDLYNGKSLGDLLMAEQQATIDTLKNNGCPVRHIQLSELNEYTLGSLMMGFILETLAMAKLIDVNPFDQPAVEESKILTRKYLKG